MIELIEPTTARLGLRQWRASDRSPFAELSADPRVMVPPQFSWVTGEHLTQRFDLSSAQSFATTVCASCGRPLPHFTRSGREVVVPAGTLDTVPDVVPQANIFWGSRAPWSCSGGDLPSHAEYTPSWR
jgi:hypothetical protein